MTCLTRRRQSPTALVLGGIVLALALLGPGCAPAEEPAAEPSAAGQIEDTTTDKPTTSSPPPAEEEEVPEADATTAAAPPPPPRPRPGLHVASVIDGDTIELDNGKRVRLVQIDAPEAHGECYGRKAGTVLRRLLPVGAGVRIVRDPNLDDVDRFGRLLRYVIRGGRNVNLVLVRQGAASVWFFDGERGRHADALLRAAERASARRLGA